MFILESFEERTRNDDFRLKNGASDAFFPRIADRPGREGGAVDSSWGKLEIP